MFVGYHASQEQFSPRELLDLLPAVEASGFSGVMTSDHITPWSVRQGQSGYTLSWLGAAMEKSALPFGTLSIPGGWRQHPVIVAQAIATLSQMYPGRLPWIAVGSGERMNEHVVGQPWPDKKERNERLFEAVDIIRSLLRGETVSRKDKHIAVDRAKLWTLPEEQPKIFAAALTPETAKWAGTWSDGLITVRKPEPELKEMIGAFHESGGAGKPVALQMQISWAPEVEDAKMNAWRQWRNATLSQQQLAELTTPEEFDRACENATIEDAAESIFCASESQPYIDSIVGYRDMGISEVYIHNAGRNQREFIEFFGASVLPEFTKKTT